MQFFTNTWRFCRRTVPVAVAASFCLLVVAARGEGHADSAKQESPVAFITSQFAIADFDGDRIPDLATVDVETGGTRGDKLYSIRFQLTSGEAQVFGVAAPAGGLQLVARDVNGDNALDLLVTTWQHKAVAVLLNDGHGNFTLSEPELFPAAAVEDEERWSFGTISFSESGVLVRLENATGELKDKNEHAGISQELGLAVLNDSLAPRSFSLDSTFGRAPPRFLIQS